MALLGCGFGGGSKHKCMAALERGGVRHASMGTGSSEQDAKSSAQIGSCMAYCEYGDATVETLYKSWRASPDGQRSSAPADKGIAIGAIPQLKQASEKCEADCAAAVKAGQSPVRTKCL